MKKSTLKKLTTKEKDMFDWKCPYVFNSRWKGDKQMFAQLSRAKLKKQTQKEIQENEKNTIEIMGQKIDMADIKNIRMAGDNIYIDLLNGGTKEFTYAKKGVAMQEFEQNETKWLEWIEKGGE